MVERVLSEHMMIPHLALSPDQVCLPEHLGIDNRQHGTRKKMALSAPNEQYKHLCRDIDLPLNSREFVVSPAKQQHIS